MTKPFELEVCCENWQQACAANEAGATRIELCSALSQGGVTPSLALIEKAVKELSLQVHVLIRPRGGDFLYNDAEIDLIKRDIEFCKKVGAHGVVFGFLKPDGQVDSDLTKQACQWAKPMKITFHRAIDMCRDPLEAIEALKEMGINYVLTSGQAATAIEGSEMLAALVMAAGSDFTIMPGSGVRVHNLQELQSLSAARAFHMSARTAVDSAMTYRKTPVRMGSQSLDEEYRIQTHDVDALRQAVKIMQQFA